METYKINPVSKTLIVSASFEKAMNDPDSDEYRLYIQLQHDIPGLKVARRTHRSPIKFRDKSGDVFYCHPHKHLTYENMKRFINALPQHEELMEVFDYIRYHAGLVQTSRYTVMRRWFEAQFPDFRKNPLFYYKKDIAVITDIEPYIKAEQEKNQEKGGVA